MRLLQIINELPGTKLKIGQFCQKAKSEILSGDYNPIPIMIQLKAIEELIKKLRTDKEISEYVNKEVELNNGKFDNDNATVIVSENGTKYDFSKCGDSEYFKLNQQLTEIETKIEERIVFLKSLPVDGLDQINEETGEIYRIYRPIKSSTSGVKITLK
jgi:hypothetical protein